MPTKTSPIDAATMRAVDEIERICFARDRETLDAHTDYANAHYARLEPIRERANKSFETAIYRFFEEIDEDTSDEKGDEVLEQTVLRVACNALADDAVLAVVAKQWISKADHDALIEGWVKFYGSMPS